MNIKHHQSIDSILAILFSYKILTAVMSLQSFQLAGLPLNLLKVVSLVRRIRSEAFVKYGKIRHGFRVYPMCLK